MVNKTNQCKCKCSQKIHDKNLLKVAQFKRLKLSVNVQEIFKDIK